MRFHPKEAKFLLICINILLWGCIRKVGGEASFVDFHGGHTLEVTEVQVLLPSLWPENRWQKTRKPLWVALNRVNSSLNLFGGSVKFAIGENSFSVSGISLTYNGFSVHRYNCLLLQYSIMLYALFILTWSRYFTSPVYYSDQVQGRTCIKNASWFYIRRYWTS